MVNIMDETKKPWKTPVLHTRGVEETLSGGLPHDTESSDYYPCDSEPGAS